MISGSEGCVGFFVCFVGRGGVEEKGGCAHFLELVLLGSLVFARFRGLSV